MYIPFPPPQLPVITWSFLAGVSIPANLCGPYYLIAHLDSTGRYEETLEGNNYVGAAVRLLCEHGELTEKEFTVYSVHIHSTSTPG